MKTGKARFVCRIALCGIAVFFIAFSARPALAATADGCAAIEPAGAPSVVISNGLVNAVILLPDAKNGFYRGARFDWSGAVWCLTFKGHNYFGPWYAKDNTKIKDFITGPVEDYRSSDGRSATGYDQAKPGELFVKPGIGVLRRIDDNPYSFNTRYPLVDGGTWTVKPGKSQISFRQNLKTQLGISYVYQKVLKLEPHKPVLDIEHELKNTGTEPLDIQVYNHDFFVIDGVTTGPGMTVRFPFTPQAAKPMGSARIDGNQIVYDHMLEKGQTAGGEITGFSDKISDFDFIVENTNTGVGVEETGTQPLAKLIFWSNPMTVCPEAYVHITIPPGQTGRWTIHYRFFAK